MTTTHEKERRDSVLLLLLILLIGFVCIILASGWALRFAPYWRLNASMNSKLNPNTDFLANQPSEFIEPLDSDILTQPVWIANFLTPGAIFFTRTPQPTNTLVSTATPSPRPNTPTPSSTTSPTWVPTLPPNTPTNTSIPSGPPTKTYTPLPAVDLGITKTDGVLIYNPGGVLTYTVTVINNGPNGVNGALLTDNIPVQIANWSWACTSQTGGASGCTAVAGSTANFTDTVNLPTGASIVYTVTANISASPTGNIVNTAIINVPAGYTDPTPGNNSATDTDTPNLQTDLSITKTDGSTTYVAGSAITYTIVVSNAGPLSATGAMVTDTFPPTQISGASWSCVASAGASCTAGGSGNIGDTVDIPVGGTLTYTVNASTSSAATGDLTNTATVAAGPGQTDPVPGNNSATDTDTITLSGDIQIAITDNTTSYVANEVKTYTITVTNNGPSNITGVLVSNTFLNGNGSSTSWTCTPSAGASCGSANDLGDVNVTVNLNSGASVTIQLIAQVVAAPSGELSNRATVTSATDPNPANDTATDTDYGSIYGNIGGGQDGNVQNINPAQTPLTLSLSSSVVVVGAPDIGNPDIIFYEQTNGNGIDMDLINLEIGDGTNWYPILNWGDGLSNPGTSINTPWPPSNSTDCSAEPDNCAIDASLLTDFLGNGLFTGITIDLDALVPPGTYSFIRITVPNSAGIDGIYVVP